jgi:8-oxo-dGTP pyrophosphatase MutT (NUDIX family)
MPADLPLTQVVASGLVVVHRDNRRFRFLALRRFSNWDFVVGGFDGGADPQQVAIDAAREFTAIDDLTFPWGDDHRDTLPVEDNQVSRYYLAQTETDDVVLQVPVSLESEEDYEYRWVTAEEAEDILPPRLAIVLEWVLKQLAAGIPAQNR